MLTGKDVQGYVYEHLTTSHLAEVVSGKVYRNGYRPRDSRLEDVVVTFTTGTADQIQEGVVTVNIYIPDIDPYGNGVLVENGARAAEIETEAANWVGTLKPSQSGYLFSLMQTIYTASDEDIHQHFVVVKLKYNYFI